MVPDDHKSHGESQKEKENNMKKKLMAVVLTAAMALSMVACGSSNSGDTEKSSKSDSSFKVGLVLDVGGVNDGSFNQTSWEGLEKAKKDFGIEGSYLESDTDADYAANIETFIDDDCDLIICVGYMLADALKEAAEENPDQKFAILDDASIDMDNVACLMFEQEQASYLVGYVAGLMTKTNNVGFVLGMSNETMNQFGYGYYAGAIDAYPDVKVQGMNANSFADAATGKADANSMITNGADIIFHAAGATGLGVIEACQEAGVYAIGVDTDQASIAPETIITSAMKKVDSAVYDTVEKTMKDEFVSGITTYDLSSSGVDISPTQDLLPDDVVAKIEEVKKQIIDGDITVPKTQKDFEAKYGDVYDLD